MTPDRNEPHTPRPAADEACLEPVRRGIEPLIFEQSRPGHRGLDLPPAGVPEASLPDLLPGVALRTLPPRLPELSEPEVVRHYTRLSHLNHAVDLGIYPLGSCTMKYNPKLNDELAALPGFADLHPYQEESEVQGRLQLCGNGTGASARSRVWCGLSEALSNGGKGEMVGFL